MKTILGILVVIACAALGAGAALVLPFGGVAPTQPGPAAAGRLAITDAPLVEPHVAVPLKSAPESTQGLVEFRRLPREAGGGARVEAPISTRQADRSASNDRSADRLTAIEVPVRGDEDVRNIAALVRAAKVCGRMLGPAIAGKWEALGGDQGFLGCPVTDEQDAPPSVRGAAGRMAQFAGVEGSLVVAHTSGPLAGRSFEVHGCVARVYRQIGGAGSWLGYPVSDQYTVPTGVRSDFEAGHVHWDERTRECKAYSK